MAARGMNNKEKQASKTLKMLGFRVFWEYRRKDQGDWWATHPKLICQYHIDTCADEAISDLKDAVVYENYQLKLEL
jgi:hypothetical protein